MAVNCINTPDIKSSAGFTLMEVLATLVILSIGLLGIASLQMNAIRGSMNALEGSVAVALAMEGADRVRANLPGVAAGYYADLQAAGADPGCISTGCDVAQLAQTDAFEWFTKINDRLPGGVGVICWDSTPNDPEGNSHPSDPWDPRCDGDAAAGIIAIKVGWDHDRNPETDLIVQRMSLMP